MDPFLFESATEKPDAAVFLYTGRSKGGADSLKDLLNFMEKSDRHHAVDGELAKIMDVIDAVKSIPEERKRYMGILSVVDYEKRDARQAGIIQGRNEGIIEGTIHAYSALGIERHVTKKKIMKGMTHQI